MASRQQQGGQPIGQGSLHASVQAMPQLGEAEEQFGVQTLGRSQQVTLLHSHGLASLQGAAHSFADYACWALEGLQRSVEACSSSSGSNSSSTHLPRQQEVQEAVWQAAHSMQGYADLSVQQRQQLLGVLAEEVLPQVQAVTTPVIVPAVGYAVCGDWTIG